MNADVHVPELGQTTSHTADATAATDSAAAASRAPDTASPSAAPLSARFGLRPLPFDPPVVLAPMEGLTLPPFRAAVAVHGGLGAVFTEFIGEHAGISRKVARREVCPPPGTKLIVQLLGKDPDLLARSTARMVEAGAFGIDLNVGCPSGRVTKGLRGAALLRDPARLELLLRAMVKAADGAVPVSAKIRAGWSDRSELGPVVRAVENAGTSFLTVHARTYRGGYTTDAQLAFVEEARSLTRMPVIANGDLVTSEAAFALLKAGRADGVMIGRGAVRNPWIFAEIAARSAGRVPAPRAPSELRAWLRGVQARFRAYLGRDRATVAKMKEVVNFLAPGIENGMALRDRVRRSHSLAEIGAAFDEALRT